MGKRSKRKKKVVVKKKVNVIPKFFKCPFCDQEDGIKIKINSREKTASLECRKCGVSNKDIPINSISEPVDVYDDWMDQVRIANVKFNPTANEEGAENEEHAEVDEDIEYEPQPLARKKESESSDSDESIQED